MASSTVTKVTVVGDMRVIFGTYTLADTENTIDITTGADYIHSAVAHVTSHVDAGDPKVFINSQVDGTSSNGTLGIATGNGVDGLWMVWVD